MAKILKIVIREKKGQDYILRGKQNRGFTFIELLIATAIFALVLLSIGQGLLAAQLTMRSAKGQLISLYLAQALLEEQLAVKKVIAIPPTPLHERPGYEAYEGYYYEITVEPVKINEMRQQEFCSITVLIYRQAPGETKRKDKVSLFAVKGSAHDF